jgi:glycosyltransferase involved in cell wall biosynthesis
MNSLYISLDFGTKSSGNLVSVHELEALWIISDNVTVLGNADINPVVFGLPNNPFFMDYLALSKVSQLYLPDIDFCHLYAGPFTNTVRYLKAKGIKTSLTLDAHNRLESINEFESLGYQYLFNVVKDDRLWAIFNGAAHDADIVIVPGTVPKNYLVSEGVKEENIKVVPHGTDIPNIDKIKIIDTDNFKVGYLGAVGPDKGLKYLIQAWSSLNYQDSTLLLAGQQSKELGSFINKYATTGKFNLIGWVENIADFYNNISVYVQPSVTEGFGIEVAEALSYGRPVICSNGAGACDLIENGINGFIVPKRDPKAIADKIDWFKDHEQELIEMGFAARRIAENYSWNNIKEMYVNVWKEMIGEK